MNSEEIRPRPVLPLLLVVFLMVWCAAFLYFRAPIESRAERSYAEPQYQLGKCYFYGIGMNRNYPQAAKWFRLAAEQGHAQAQTTLGMMYVKGLGLPQNYTIGLKWFRKAAGQGFDAAENQLGMLYAQGKGVPQDFDEATKWFSLATSHGFEPASQNLKLVAASRSSHLPQLTTRNGKTFREVTVQKIELDGLTITYRPSEGGMGLAKLGFKDLPEPLQERYGYNGDKTTKMVDAGQLAVLVPQTL